MLMLSVQMYCRLQMQGPSIYLTCPMLYTSRIACNRTSCVLHISVLPHPQCSLVRTMDGKLDLNKASDAWGQMAGMGAMIAPGRWTPTLLAQIGR